MNKSYVTHIGSGASTILDRVTPEINHFHIWAQRLNYWCESVVLNRLLMRQWLLDCHTSLKHHHLPDLCCNISYNKRFINFLFTNLIDWWRERIRLLDALYPLRVPIAFLFSDFLQLDSYGLLQVSLSWQSSCYNTDISKNVTLLSGSLYFLLPLIDLIKTIQKPEEIYSALSHQ
jgi:hypothetical protein